MASRVDSGDGDCPWLSGHLGVCCPMRLDPLKIATRERLSEVRYEIRGELARRARELEAPGRTLVKLNIGNPGSFGFRAPGHRQPATADGTTDRPEGRRGGKEGGRTCK